MGIVMRMVVIVLVVLGGLAVWVLADDGEVIRAWNDALRAGGNPSGMDTRHLIEVERDRDAMKVRYLDPSRVEVVGAGRLKVTWLMLSGVVMAGEVSMARVETEFLCEEGLSRGVGAMTFSVTGGFLGRVSLPDEWMEVDEAEKVLLGDYCGIGEGVE